MRKAFLVCGAGVLLWLAAAATVYTTRPSDAASAATAEYTYHHAAHALIAGAIFAVVASAILWRMLRTYL